MADNHLKKLFEERFIPPNVYRTVLLRAFGRRWAEWEPETVWSEIDDEFGVVPIEEVRNKINALKILVSRKNFWDDYPAFENIVLAFNDRHVEPYENQVCTPEELAYGITVANMIKLKNFSREIVHYIRGCCEEDGLIVYPRAFSFAQPGYDDEYRRDLVSEVRRIWDIERFTQIRVPAHEASHPVMVQVGRLHDIEVYVQERLDKGLRTRVA